VVRFRRIQRSIKCAVSRNDTVAILERSLGEWESLLYGTSDLLLDRSLLIRCGLALAEMGVTRPGSSICEGARSD